MRPDPPVLRLFVAVRVPDDVKEALRDEQARLRGVLAPQTARWTPPDALHLTLRFLGDVAAARVGDLERTLRAAVSDAEAPALACAGLGCFPDLRAPRVVWAGVADDEGRLARLFDAVDLAVDDFAPTSAPSRFVGHVTLARLRHVGRPEAARLARHVEETGARPFGAWRATELELVRSEPARGGVRHTTLARVGLRPGG